MRRLRRWLAGQVWRLSALLAARRAARLDGGAARQLFRTQTRGMGLRLSEHARDRLRPRWLRLRRSDAE